MQLGRDWKDVKKMAGRYKKASKLSEKHKTLALEEWNALYVAVTRPMLKLRGHERVCFPPSDLDDEYVPMDAVEDRERPVGP